MTAASRWQDMTFVNCSLCVVCWSVRIVTPQGQQENMHNRDKSIILPLYYFVPQLHFQHFFPVQNAENGCLRRVFTIKNSPKWRPGLCPGPAGRIYTEEWYSAGKGNTFPIPCLFSTPSASFGDSISSVTGTSTLGISTRCPGTQY